MLPRAGTMSARIRNRTVAIDRRCALALSVPDVSSISYSGHGKHGHVTFEFDVAAVNKTLSVIFEGAALQNSELSPQLDLASPAGKVLKALSEAVGAGMHDTRIRSEKSMALLGESILRPDAKVVAGFQPIMPSYEGLVDEEEMLQLLAFIKSLGPGQTPPRTEEAEPPAVRPALKGPKEKQP